MKPITWYKSLAESKNRRQYGYFLIEGKRAVDQVLTHHRDSVEELLCTDEIAPSITTIPVRIISAAHMKSICTSRTPQGIAALVRIPDDIYTDNIPALNTRGRVLLLEHIQDPGNVGTLIRTAAAFGIDGVILSGQCADPFSPKVIQSTAGSILSVWIRKTDRYLPLTDTLKEKYGCKMIAADLNGSDIRGFSDPGAHILALGNEGSGLSGELLGRCDCRIRIPIEKDNAESLNVAVSGAILMFVLGGSVNTP